MNLRIQLPCLKKKKKGGEGSHEHFFPPKVICNVNELQAREGLPVSAFLSHLICLLQEPGISKNSSAGVRVRESERRCIVWETRHRKARELKGGREGIQINIQGLPPSDARRKAISLMARGYKQA